jgi:hypothetical protein
VKRANLDSQKDEDRQSMDFSLHRIPVDTLKEIFTCLHVGSLSIITLVCRHWRACVIDPRVLQCMVAETERLHHLYLRQCKELQDSSTRYLQLADLRVDHLPVMKKNIKIYCKAIGYSEDDTIIFRSLLQVPNYVEEALLDGCELLCLLDQRALRCVRYLFTQFPPLALESLDRTTQPYRTLRRLLVFLLTNTSLYHAASVTVSRYSLPQDDGKPVCAPPLVRYATERDVWALLCSFLNGHQAMVLEIATSLLMLNCGDQWRNQTFDQLRGLLLESTAQQAVTLAQEKLNVRQREQEAAGKERLRLKKEREEQERRDREARIAAERQKKIAELDHWNRNHGLW